MTVIDDRERGPTPASARPDPEPSLATLFGELSEETKLMVRLETELAKAELGEALDHAKKAGAGFGAAGVLGYIAVMFLSFAAAFGLAEILPTGVAFLIVAVVWAVAAAIGFGIGRKNLNALDPVPRRTVQALKEDITWLRHRTS
ncbi:MAG: phage holin family protein [Acidimicrobiia bacterium]|nr:phage holin family protein [Acidimicrobiia bacterium]